jgi:hypothetical protein
MTREISSTTFNLLDFIKRQNLEKVTNYSYSKCQIILLENTHFIPKQVGGTNWTYLKYGTTALKGLGTVLHQILYFKICQADSDFWHLYD